ncbi:MAG: hypothetical protein JSU74_05510 [Candidatus Zixiibacteriota bacterium]|nr:MAG: hypothetical protein JSU74_05510 [candidate division Zixibacteria bacterium]
MVDGRLKSLVVKLAIIGLSAVFLASCANHPKINAEGPYWKDDDMKGIPEPEYEEPSLVWTSLKRTLSDQAIELLDMDRNVRKIAGRPVQAKNTNCFDEVPNSSWFTNRHGHPQTRLYREQIEAGPDLTDGPDTSGVWEVFRPKVGGATPGFWIEDSRGDQYIIKFDPADNPEMATAAAAMASRYFYACGYNVPQESIVYWRPENLRVRKGATIKDRSGNKRPLTMNDINDILKKANREPDGSIRSLASLNVGNVKGPFMYEGIRKDDPNDWCPHEHRRELRGLYVMGSLVNHYDLKDHNSMDVYVGEDGSGYLKHFLMDFGSSFGSDGQYVKIPRKGYANMFDLRDIGVSTITFGLKTWAWQNAKPYQYPSIGYFESELFEPDKFDPIVPNPAFEQLTDQDAYWGAKIVLSFSDDDLAAIVETGRLSDQNAAAYLLKTLVERRDKIGRHWFGKINPLDYPAIESDDQGLQISFVDLAVEHGLEPATATYQYEMRYKGKVVLGVAETDQTRISVSSDERDRLLSLLQPAGSSSTVEDDVLELRVRTRRVSGDVGKPVTFWLMPDQRSNGFAIAGIKH